MYYSAEGNVVQAIMFSDLMQTLKDKNKTLKHFGF